MTSEKEEENLRIQRDIMSGRQFSMAEAIAREGGNFLKGESPVPKMLQLTTEINVFIANNLQDSLGSLQAVLQNWVKQDKAIVSKYLNSPLSALKEIIEKIIENQELLYDFVKQVDFQWGQMYGERPYFQSPGQPAHPDDEYTHESVKQQLIELLNKIES
ncbi:MAG: hypothetical protein DSM107014_07700 [Gomphosphaeria aponina SAG 52.96 = DSM 107014]|uniref:Uncharacterized protein n=1 Tax=Gomphosphaeria aponina SAG 52.96 = DSM 107014 TaxID=1521640 RepID=A0A941GTB6_9CHRO|nr:hypothetical protein [Gomphosphaeria aponina SAG 52.96 = DSM 107014]